MNLQAVVRPTDERQQTAPDTGKLRARDGGVVKAVGVELVCVWAPDLLEAVHVVDRWELVFGQSVVLGKT